MGTGSQKLPVIRYLDTHVAAWLYFGKVQKLTMAARKAIEEGDLLISPMVYLEFQYLREKRVIAIPPDEMFTILNTDFGVSLCTYPFSIVSREATGIEWTRDPFDRIIVAQAIANSMSPLITADEKIRDHYKKAVW